MVVPSTAQDTRRWPRLAREVHAAAEGLQAVVRVAETHEDACQADAEGAAARRRASQTPDHDVVVRVAARPQYGRGRPRQHTPRAVQTMRYGLTCPLNARDATLVRNRAAAGGFVWRTHGPTEGGRAHRAGDVLRGYTNPQGIEQHVSCLKDPLIVNSLLLKKPARIEALGLV